MHDMIFRGNLEDFLESKNLDIMKFIRFGIIDENELCNIFEITMPTVSFSNPVDIVRVDNDSRNQTFYILKFSIAGNTDVLDYKPSTSFITMPEWVIRNGEIWFQIEEQDLETMKTHIDGLIETFKSHLIDISTDIHIYNTTLRTNIQKLTNAYNNKISSKNKNMDEIRNHLLFRD